MLLLATPIDHVLPMEIASSQGPKTGVNTPDSSELPDVVSFLFGVSCSPVIEPFSLGCNNRVCITFFFQVPTLKIIWQIFLLTLQVPDGDASRIPKQVLARVSQSWKADSDISLESEVRRLLFASCCILNTDVGRHHGVRETSYHHTSPYGVWVL